MATLQPKTRARLERPESDRYPWIAMGVVLIGTFMVILDTTIVNVALPQIGQELRRVDSLDWVVTAYLLSVGIVQPATGWLADRFGRKRIFTLSLGAFAVGSLLCALAPNLLALVGFRVLQGLGGGAMMPVGLTMIYELFPPDRRGRALGIWGIAAMAAPAIGPVVGGWLATSFAWRSIFLVNVPIGAIGVVCAIVLLRDTGFREERPLDSPSLVLAIVGLTALLLGFSQARDWGWGSPSILALLATGTAAMALFVRRGLRVEHPAIALEMFRERTFAITVVIAWLVIVAQFARLVFIPIELQTLRGMSAFETGLVLVPAALTAAIGMPIGGRLADAVGARLPVAIGTSAVGLGALMLGLIDVSTPIWHVVVYLSIQGLGVGFALMPSAVVGLNALPQRFVAQASAVRSVNRQIAGALGVGILSTFVASRLGTVSAVPGQTPVDLAQSTYNGVFLIAFGLCVVALMLVPLLPSSEQNRRILADRRREQDELAATIAS